MPEICSIISTPLFSGLWKICIVLTLIFEKKQGYAVFRPYLKKKIASEPMDGSEHPYPTIEYPHPPTALVPVKFLEMQRGKLQVSPKHKETQTMSIYLGISRIALFGSEQFRQIYLVERICICICIWIDVFVFVFEWKLNKIFVSVFVFEKSKFLYLYLYLYLIKRIWPQPWSILLVW